MERNIFHLNPPPPPEPEKPKVEVPVVKISGFVNIGHKKTVLFVSQPKDKKDGPIYYSLTEGEKSADGKLELLKIHSAEESVDVINDGVTQTALTAKDDTRWRFADRAAAPVAAGRSATRRPTHRSPAYRDGGFSRTGRAKAEMVLRR